MVRTKLELVGVIASLIIDLEEESKTSTVQIGRRNHEFTLLTQIIL